MVAKLSFSASHLEKRPKDQKFNLNYTIICLFIKSLWIFSTAWKKLNHMLFMLKNIHSINLSWNHCKLGNTFFMRIILYGSISLRIYYLQSSGKYECCDELILICWFTNSWCLFNFSWFIFTLRLDLSYNYAELVER